MKIMVRKQDESKSVSVYGFDVLKFHIVYLKSTSLMCNLYMLSSILSQTSHKFGSKFGNSQYDEGLMIICKNSLGSL